MARWLCCFIVTFTIGLFFSSGQAFAQPPAPEPAVAVPEAAAPEAPAPAAVLTPVETAQKTADEALQATKDTVSTVNVLWTCLAAFLVFFMQMGFACVESGLTRAKNTCNIMMKNIMDFSIGSIVFWAVGFGLMFGTTNGFVGRDQFLVDPDSKVKAEETLNAYGKDPNFHYAFLMFQTVFAATAATIVSGAMAERTKFSSYLIYSAIISMIIYPISGGWAWNGLWSGGGWLEAKSGGVLDDWVPFHDFAGSTVVHLCGGVAALAGAIAVGPRKGKFNADGSANAIPGHNLPLAFIGVFVLWLGWFGFNPGSTTAIGKGEFAPIAFVTNLAGAAGALSAMFTAWCIFKKPEATMTMNGALGGLVAITAGCDIITPVGGIVVGAIAGVIVVLAVLAIDKIKVDDPVGAIAVHCCCGAFGTLMCAVPFVCKAEKAASMVTQAVGVGSIMLWTFVTMSIVFQILKFTVGLRVSDQEQFEGLDGPEHGNTAYPDFMLISEH